MASKCDFLECSSTERFSMQSSDPSLPPPPVGGTTLPSRQPGGVDDNDAMDRDGNTTTACCCSASSPTPESIRRTVDAILARTGRDADRLLPILRAIQEEYRYVPPAALQHLADVTPIPAADITGVSTFYAQFRHRPAGRHTIAVCIGTACHVKGADRIHHAFQRHLGIPEDQDVDAARRYTLERVGCLGCCMLAPAVRIDDTIYGPVTPEEVGALLQDFEASRTRPPPMPTPAPDGTPPGAIRLCLCSSCLASGADALRDAFHVEMQRAGLHLPLMETGCTGLSVYAPLVEIIDGTGTSYRYRTLHPTDVPSLLRRHFTPCLGYRIRDNVRNTLDRLLTGTRSTTRLQDAALEHDTTWLQFMGTQERIATEALWELDPLSIESYRAHGGLLALEAVLAEGNPDAGIARLETAGLRGRGGGGFPTATKIRAVRMATTHPKALICNGDEGDPGAFMDRMLLESCPFRVLEGMMIAAYLAGVSRGAVYIRSEYPVAVERIRRAIDIVRDAGLLDKPCPGTAFSLHLEVVEGAGAFVCGEETALIASMEGRRGMPRLKPPYPSERGWNDLPTLICNVETCTLIPWILHHGADAFTRIGTPASRGTKVFSLAGKVRRGGLIEVPMGTTLRAIVEEVGGGVEENGTLKAVQIGGPSGGCVPAHLADTPVDYEALQAAGAIMGSGGIVVLDTRDCMVDIARYFLAFTQAESCGRCTPCRIGTRRMLEILEALCQGRATRRDLETLESLAHMIRKSSLCGLGQSAPNPVLSTLTHFRDEYEAHLRGHCPAHACTALIAYRITDRCIGCTRCAQHCPVDAIAFAPYTRHTIDAARCVRCGQCQAVCPQDAVEVISPCPV